MFVPFVRVHVVIGHGLVREPPFAQKSHVHDSALGKDVEVSRHQVFAVGLDVAQLGRVIGPPHHSEETTVPRPYKGAFFCPPNSILCILGIHAVGESKLVGIGGVGIKAEGGQATQGAGLQGFGSAPLDNVKGRLAVVNGQILPEVNNPKRGYGI